MMSFNIGEGAIDAAELTMFLICSSIAGVIITSPVSTVALGRVRTIASFIALVARVLLT